VQEKGPQITIDALRAAMALAPFDGRSAQMAMEPAWRGAPPPRSAEGPPRTAAALAYVYEENGALQLPLTLRRHDLREHRGQVSLPGGRPEAGERSEATAWREAREEIGLAPSDGVVLGTLAPVYIPVTHTTLSVHVATGEAPTALVAQPSEVARIVVVPLGHLADPARHKRRVVETHGREVDVPWFDVGGLFLWGATAMALHELVARLAAVR
jgi:8-oxo-dGTP pyrophosphatase MutT (NUDIX family)